MQATKLISFPISEDDDIWVARFKGTSSQLIEVISQLLANPEDFLGSASCPVNRWPILKHLKQLSSSKRNPYIDRMIFNADLKGVLKQGNLPPKNVTSIQTSLLFDTAEPVTIFFQYGEIKEFSPKTNNFVSVNDTIVIQGEYGTNVVRVQCPATLDTALVRFKLTTSIHLTVTPTNVCYVHYDIDDTGGEIFSRIATLALSPRVAENALNVAWTNNPKELVLGADTGQLLRRFPNLTGKPRSPEDFKKALAKRQVIFRVPGLKGFRGGGLRYEFVFQAMSGRRPSSNTSLPNEASCSSSATTQGNSATTPSQPSLISTCVKDVATLDPTILFISPEGVIYVDLESSQMMRWVLSGISSGPS